MNKFQAKEITKPSLEMGNKKFVEKEKVAFFNFFSSPVYSGKHNITCVVIFSRNADVVPMMDTFAKTAKNLKVDLQLHKLDLKDACKERDYNSGI